MSLPNFYVTTLAQSLQTGGSETEIYVNSITTADGQVISIADFAIEGGTGYIIVDPQSSANVEYISFTGVDAINTGFTGAIRGLSFKGDGAVIVANKLFHATGATVIIGWSSYDLNSFVNKYTAQTLQGTITFSVPPISATLPTGATQVANKAYVDQAISGTIGTASTLTFGTSRISVNPATPNTPISVGDNDPRVPTQAENDALVGTAGTPSSTNKYVTNDDTTGSGSVVRASVTNALVKFGGTGADGALTITSGATNIDLAGAQVVVKNYTSISITGTASLTFTNPHANGTLVILKSQGNATITSSANPTIDLRSMGASVGSNGASFGAIVNAGSTAGSTTGAAGGIASASIQKSIAGKYIPVAAGAGGGNASGSTGGAGGGSLYIECAGALNFGASSVINASAANGGNGNGGAGGGAGGSVVVIYNTLTANSGTITLNGGNGGNGSNGSQVGGGGGGANRIAGAAGGSGGTAGGSGSSGGNAGSDDGTGGTGGAGGSGVGGNGGGGGGGGGGWKLITSNTEFN